ncbi:hypothetical protein Golax_010761, partial [Gossypium laxum]|nr:hypothetical protein [Gossypium laxum]
MKKLSSTPLRTAPQLVRFDNRLVVGDYSCCIDWLEDALRFLDLKATRCFKEKIVSAEWVELEAFEESLKVANSFNISKAVFGSDCASLASGQAGNFKKSRIFFIPNKIEGVRWQLFDILGVHTPLDHGRYLGVPSLECGMGFRNLRFFNLAMVAKQGWKLFSNPILFSINFSKLN